MALENITLRLARLRLASFFVILATAALLLAGPGLAQTQVVYNAWTQQSPGNVPAARQYHSMATDANGHVLLFGGTSAITRYLSDTWIWNGTNWNSYTGSGPTGRLNAAVGANAAGQVVLFGGDDGTSGGLGDTWVWNGTSWSNASPGTSPSPRFSASMAQDSLGHAVLFGGIYAYPVPGVQYTDTWTWNGTTWTKQNPTTVPTGQGPMAYDATTRQTLMFDGTNTWSWNGTNWAKLAPVHKPSYRVDFSLAYDAASAQVVLYGGFVQNTVLGDTWTWNGTDWTQQSYTVNPPTTQQLGDENGMAYDAVGQQLVLFGGAVNDQTTSSNQTWTYNPGAYNFGSVNVCPGTQTTPAPCSASQFFTFNVSSDINIPTGPLIGTQGTRGGDFSISFSQPYTGLCAGFVGPDYTRTCQVLVQFAPKAPGLRTGAVQLYDSNNNLQATVPLYGIGQAPAVAFPLNSTPTVVVPASSYQPRNLAVDANGNVFVAQYSTTGATPDKVLEIKGDGSGTTSISTLVPTPNSQGGSGLFGVAVDGAGDLYVNDPNNLYIYEIPVGCQAFSCYLQAGVGGYEANQIAVDAVGNLFVATAVEGVRKFAAACVGSSNIASCGISLGSGWKDPTGIAVDSAGNVYVADPGTTDVVMIPADGSAQTTVGVGLAAPSAVAVDAAGDVFIADTTVRYIIEVPVGCTTAACQLQIGSGFINPVGVAVDPAGNVYVSDNEALTVSKISLSTPPSVAFANTLAGETSNQSFFVQNIGNQPLTAYSTNPETTAPFLNYLISGTVGDAYACLADFSLAAGTICDQTIQFAPSVAGGAQAYSSTFTLDDNALNSTLAQQVIPVTGTSTALTSTTTTVSAPTVNYPANGVVTVSVTSGVATPVGVGSVALSVDYVSVGSMPLNAAGQAIFTLTSPAPPSHSLSASYSPGTGYAASSGTGSLTVLAAAASTSTSLSVNPNPVAVGKVTTLTATVLTGGSTPVNSGSVQFTPGDGSAAQTVPLSNGQATLLYIYSTAGQYIAKATYLGNASYLPSPSGLAFVDATQAFSFVVNTLSDDATGIPANCASASTTPCTLRDAIEAANTATAYSSGTNITFAPALAAGATQAAPNVIGASGLTGGSFGINGNMTITGLTGGSGTGAFNAIAIDGSDLGDRIFTFFGGGVTALNNLILRNGRQGGIYISGGTLTVSNSTISGNSNGAGGGGGIYVGGGTVTVSNSTLSGNSSPVDGGGIFVANGTVTVANSTLSGNHADATGGGISGFGGTVTIINCTFSGNTAGLGSSPNDIDGRGSAISLNNSILVEDSFTAYSATSSNNITGNANLSLLSYYGGVTQTMVPLPSSAAICAGNSTLAGVSLTDQRGVKQTNLYCPAGTIDSGAVQTTYAMSFTTEPPTTATIGAALTISPAVTLTENGTPLAAATSIAVADSASPSALAATSTLLASTSAGVATFSNLVFGSPASGDKLTAALTLTLTASGATTPVSITALSTGITASAATVAVTVSANYPAAAISVDGGTAVGGTQSFTWTIGSQHTFSTNSAQVIGGALYVLHNWPDGTTEPFSDLVTASAGTTSYVATFAAQYFLTVSAGTGGSTFGSATTAFYGAGLSESLVATPNAGYYFTGWTGSSDIASPSSASTTVAMNGAETVTANFAPIPTLVVTTNADDAGLASNCTPQTTAGTGTDASCSLRDALLAAAVGGGYISFDGTAFSSTNTDAQNTITLGSTGTLNVPANTTITGTTTGTGTGLHDRVTISGASTYGVFSIGSGTVALNGLSIIKGSAPSGGGIYNNGTLTLSNCNVANNNVNNYGGGISNSGTLQVIQSLVSGNSSRNFGGGFDSTGTLTVSDSTITGNSSGRDGGGIMNENGASVVIASSTITGNTAGSKGGGIGNYGNSASLANTIVSGNQALTNGPDTFPNFTDNGGNIIGKAANLSSLGSYGGPTQTVLPLPGSAAICAGTLANATAAGISTDQRGFAFNPSCPTGSIDAGAVQTTYAMSFTTEPPATATIGTPLTTSPAVTLTENGTPLAAATSIAVADTASPSALAASSTLSAASTSSGVATFSNLVFGSPASGDKLNAALTLTASGATTPVSITAQSTGITAASPTVAVTVSSNVAGARISVDGGIAVAGTQSFTWTIGSPHTFSTLPMQTAGGGWTQYLFVNWPDGTTSSTLDTVTASAGTTSYVATFTTEYFLAVNPGAGGSTSSSAVSTFYPAGQSEALVATPNAGYYFAGWTGSADIASPSSASTTVTMNGPETVIANFAPIPTLVVTTNADDAGLASNCTPQTTAGTGTDASCSLRDALLAATPGGGNITFDGTAFSSTNTSAQNTIILSSEETLIVPANTTITGTTTGTGTGLHDRVTISGADSTHVFYIALGTVTFNNLAIVHGHSGDGGGIVNSGTLTLNNCLIANNQASSGGGGIYNSGTLSVIGSLIENNTVSAGLPGGGGGIFEDGAPATVTIKDSTLTGNTAPGGLGGGILQGGGSMVITNSTITGNSAAISGGIAPVGTTSIANTVVSGNQATEFGPDVYGSYSDNGGNIVGTAANLSSLGSYGGPTQSILPLPGSAAICAGTLANATAAGINTDQRGFAFNPSCPTGSIDSGAVQTTYAMSFTTEPPATATIGTALTTSPVVTLTENGTPLAAATSIAVADTASPSALAASSTLSASTSAGVATFSNLVFGSPASGDELTATLPLTASTATLPLTASTATLPLTASTATTPVSITAQSTGITTAALLKPIFQFQIASGLMALTSTQTFSITVYNPNASAALSNISETITLTAGLQVVSGSLTSTCQGGSVTYPSNNGTITRSGLSLAGGAHCTDTYTVKAISPGSQSINATLLENNSSTGNTISNPISVTDLLSSLKIGVPTTAYQGGSFTVTVEAVDPSGNADANYTGTVGFTSSDTAAGLPGSYTFTAADAGTHTFSVTLNTTGKQTITATDSADTLAIVSSNITVSIPNLVVTTARDDAGTAANCTKQTTPGTGTDASCSLRDALAEAATLGSGNITFDGTAFSSSNTDAQNTITLGSTGTLNVPANTTITGATTGTGTALHDRVTISGAGIYGVFSVASGTVALNGLAIIEGSAQSGGGIYNNGTLTVSNCTVANSFATNSGGGIGNNGTLKLIQSLVSNNTAVDFGGGIYNTGTLTDSDSTITGNSAYLDGGGVANDYSGVAVIINSTITGNTSGNNGGGTVNYGSSLSLANTIVSGNQASNDGPDTWYGFTDKGGNIIGTAANLSSLGSYGGQTQTILPLPGSVAICAGTLANATSAGISSDQRGFAFDPACPAGSIDSGAVQTHYGLSFSASPSSAVVAQTLSPSPAVTVTESGLPLTAGAATITLSDATKTLAGPTTESTLATTGKATFPSLTIGLADTSDKLTATLILNAALTSPLSLTTTSGGFAVIQSTPTVTWNTPAPINYGTALSATQLDATAPVAGKFVYTPPATTVLGAGTQKLSVLFTPTSSSYSSVTKTVSLLVNRATPTVTWATPAPITYGTPLSATQLNATTTIPGKFLYTPATGTVLKAGASQTLSVTFTPTDTVDYATVKASVLITVTQATPKIVWPTPAAIPYGTALSSTQLNATANTAGSFLYTPITGTVLKIGASQTLSVTFTPTDATDYTSVKASTLITVSQASTTTTVTSSTNPSAYGQPVTFTATVKSLTANGETGTITWTPAICAKTTVTAAGASVTAKCTTSGMPVGTDTVTATYSGDSNFLLSSGTLTSGQKVQDLLVINPAFLSFPSVNFGASLSKSVTLTNTGTTAVTLTGIAIPNNTSTADLDGDPQDFQFTTTCGASLAAGKSCTVTIKFSAVGPHQQPYAQLIVTDSAYGSPQAVSLNASINEPIATLNPTKLAFATQKASTTSAAKPITLTNTGNAPLALTNLAITGNFALATGTTCTKTTTLQPKAACTIDVTFTPTSTGAKTGSITLTNVSTAPSLTIPLTGTGN